MSSESIRQTPSRLRESAELAFVRKIDTISDNTFSPDFRHSSVTVRLAVYGKELDQCSQRHPSDSLPPAGRPPRW